jgi:hypothetical protein
MELKECARNDPYFLSKFVTGDENLIYLHYPELKQQSSKWNCPPPPAEESAASEKLCEVNTDLHFDSDRIIHKEFVFPGQTVNAMFCCYTLRWRRGDNVEAARQMAHELGAPSRQCFRAHRPGCAQFLSSKNVTVQTLGFSTSFCCAIR